MSDAGIPTRTDVGTLEGAETWRSETRRQFHGSEVVGGSWFVASEQDSQRRSWTF